MDALFLPAPATAAGTQNSSVLSQTEPPVNAPEDRMESDEHPLVKLMSGGWYASGLYDVPYVAPDCAGSMVVSMEIGNLVASMGTLVS